MRYGECRWWCQTGKGFPSTPTAAYDFGLFGMRWHCPDCDRSWVYTRRHQWHQESRLRHWLATGGGNHYWLVHPEWLHSLRVRIDAWLADRRYPERRAHGQPRET